MALVFHNYNGAIIPANQQVLALNNRAFHYGDGLFESMRMIKGQLQYAGLHAKRLQQGMKALKLSDYAKLDADFLREKARELSIRNKAKNGSLHLTVFRDWDGLDLSELNKAGYAIEWETLEDQQYTLNTRGLIMSVYEDVPKAINSLSNLKTCNALNHVLAGIFKQHNRLNDAFILNQNGFLCET
ncbi:MAG: 4-amino-4-deoxychorismate lyase, partial [Sphingobacteriaceae bacterium]